MKSSKISKRFLAFSRKNWFEILCSALAFLFSLWLMTSTFSYNRQTHSILIATKAWSDFASHIPLIRSFSWGNNLPPEFPLFPGKPIRYHFLFYALVGMFERLGLTINWALNLPSTLFFFALLMAIYLLAKLLFKNRFVPALSVILFLFNGSFSFLEFFKTNPLSFQTPAEIFQNTSFPSFGPYDGKTVSAFWNLNIYTNQRHLALAFAWILAIMLLILKPIAEKKPFSVKRAFFTGLFLSLLPLFHSAGFVMALLVLGVLFLLLKGYRRAIFILLSTASFFGLPQVFFLRYGSVTGNFRFNPGYLIAGDFSFSNFIYYWFLNLGLAFFLIPLGFIKANSLAKRVFLAFSSFFILGNLFQFSSEMAANHKFFNLFLIIGNVFVAYTIYLIWQKKILGKMFALVLIFFLTLSGVIDFFPIKNDTLMTIADAPANPDVAWIRENTPPRAVFLNSSYLYHPASLAGRKIFLGWPYFPWSIGYNTHERDSERIEILEASHANKAIACNILKRANIQFVFLGYNDPETLAPNSSFWENNFVKAYNNPKINSTIYDVKRSCL